MKYQFIFLLMSTLMFGCTSKIAIYYQDNSKIEVTIDKIKGCDGLAEEIRNNFFFNKNDSLYLENIGFFIHQLSNQYFDCIGNLTANQIIELFGTPHLKTEDKLFYFIKKNGSVTLSARTFEINGNFVKVGEEVISLNHSDLNIQSIIKYSKFKKATFLKETKYYKVDIATQNNNCIQRKATLGNNIFFHKKRKYFIVNSKTFESLMEIEYPVSCSNSFTEKEILTLFGKPLYSKNKSLYYPLYDKAYLSHNGRTKSKNGLIYCIRFVKSKNKFYNYGIEWISPDLLN